MNDQEAYEYYLDPAHLVGTGPGRKRAGQLTLSEITSIRFRTDVIETVRVLAEAEHISVGHWVRRAIDNELKRYE